MDKIIIVAIAIAAAALFIYAITARDAKGDGSDPDNKSGSAK